MRNLFLCLANCFVIAFTTLNIQAQNNEHCSADYLLSELTTDKEADDELLVYLLNEKRYNGTAVKHMEGKESCMLYIIENGIIIKRWGFFSNGNLSREEYFKEGLPHGLCIQYFENGRKSSEINYKSGVLHGNSNKWAKDGSVLRLAKYNLGNLISEKF